MNAKRLKTLLGLEIGKRRLCAVELRRLGDGRLEARRVAQAELALDPFSASPELAGKAIRDALDAAGIRAAQCVVCLPLGQALLHQTAIPALDAADTPSFLQLEAERAFPFSPDDLMISSSLFDLPGGEHFATLSGMLTSQTTALENCLKAAKLRPVSFTLGVTALGRPDEKPQGVMLAGDAGVELMVTRKGGLITLRPLGEMHAPGADALEIDATALCRDCRITLGRLPRSIHGQLQTIELFGSPKSRAQARELLGPELEACGIQILDADPLAKFGVTAHAEALAAPAPIAAAALAAAVRGLNGEPQATEYLTERVNRARQLAAQFMARGLLWKLGGAAGALAAIVALAFVWQIWRLNSLQGKWSAMQTDAQTLGGMQNNIHTFRPWYDDHIRSLELMKTLAEAFPEQGDVWARTLDIKSMSEVNVTGLASNESAYRKMFDSLREKPQIDQLSVDQLRSAKTGVQFSAKFNWTPEDGDGE